MAKILVSLLSDQTIPNILYIRECKDIDKYIFISTVSMDKKGVLKWITETCDIENYISVSINQDDPRDIKSKLTELRLSANDEYFCNITGGTKVMSLTVYNFFQDFESKIVYLPIGKNTIYQLYPSTREPYQNIITRLNVFEYLSSYGINVINDDFNEVFRTVHDEKYCYHYFNCMNKNFEYIRNNFDKKVIQPLRSWQIEQNKFENKRDILLNRLMPDLVDLPKFINYIKYPVKNNRLTYKEVSWLLGNWLEDFSFFLFKEKLNIEDDYIANGVKIRKDASNELDIIFVMNNKIYVAECKTGFNKREFKEEFDKAAYKSKALRDEFGIQVEGILILMAPFHRNSDDEVEIAYKERIIQTKNRLLDKYILNNEIDSFFQELKKDSE